MSGNRNKIDVTVRVFIQNANGEILLARALREENLLTVPGGHVEFGERAEDTVVREIHEEVGLKIKEIKFLTFTETIRPHEHYVVLRFSAKLNGENQEIKLLKEEFSEYVWLTPTDAMNHQEIKPNAKKMIEDYFVKK